MMLQTVTFLTLTSLSSWYMLFQWQTIMAETESAKQACKNHTVSVEDSPYLLLNNTSFGYWK